MKNLVIGIIGGGAAGYFSALSAKHHFPEHQVIIFEKSNKTLSKVKVSGGGRCNVTHACYDNNLLSKYYPRGEKFLRKAFDQFNTTDTIEWFKKRGVLLETLPDNCIFPKSNSSQTIIDCFENEARKLGVEVRMSTPINKVTLTSSNQFELLSTIETFCVDRLIITTGGTPKLAGLKWIEDLGHTIVEPFPSLFTFNMPKNPICELMGIVNEQSTVKIEGTKLIADGPLLITHWGMSGPAILKLSAWGARILAEKGYNFNILVNWLYNLKDFQVLEKLEAFLKENPDKLVINYNPFGLTKRLWQFIVNKSEIHPETRWKAIGKKQTNKLVNNLINDLYPVTGKTTFKEEFVTAGGVDLKEVEVNTLQSKQVKGLFFAGEILDIDGITGGFNFQAAWTTAWIAGKNVGLSNLAD